MSFRSVCYFDILGGAYEITVFGLGLCPVSIIGHRTHLDKGYSPTDVLLAGPQPTDVLDVLYHVV